MMSIVKTLQRIKTHTIEIPILVFLKSEIYIYTNHFDGFFLGGGGCNKLGSHYVDQAGLELICSPGWPQIRSDPPASASGVLESHHTGPFSKCERVHTYCVVAHGNTTQILLPVLRFFLYTVS